MAGAPSVWGRIRAPEASASKAPVAPEDACRICLDSVPASVRFRPCGHRMCYSCVEKNRARNIFLADKGVKCPFCRRFIEEYVATDGGSAEALALLQDANKAAAAAAAARNPLADQKSPRSAQDMCWAYSDTQWRCLPCRTLNPYSEEACSQCSRRKQDSIVPPPPPRGKDLSRYDASDFVAVCKAQYHPNLNGIFLEAGVPMSCGKVSGTEESIALALRKGGHLKLVHAINSIAGGGHIKELSRHFFGNYTLQDLLEACEKIREVARQGSKYGLDQDLVDGLLRNGGSFGVLYCEVLDGLAESVMHPQAGYVVQKVVSLCTLEELLGVFARMLPHAQDITCDPKGAHVMLRMVEKLNIYCEGDENGNAQSALNKLCGFFYQDPLWCTNIANTLLGSKVLIESLCGALPKYNGLRVGSLLASVAGDLVYNQFGLNTIMELLSLEKPSASDILRDLVCSIALSLQGSFGMHAANETLPTQTLVSLLIERLTEEGEKDWVLDIVKELISKGDVLMNSGKGFNLLSAALASEALPVQAVDEGLTNLETRGCNVVELEDTLEYLRVQRPPCQNPRGLPSSVLTPILKSRVECGFQIPPPPPPPPREVVTPRNPVGEGVRGPSSPIGEDTQGHTKQSVGLQAQDSWTDNGYPKGLPTPPAPTPYEEESLGSNRVCYQLPDNLCSPAGSVESDTESAPAKLGSLAISSEVNNLCTPLDRLLGPGFSTGRRELGSTAPETSKPWVDNYSSNAGVRLQSVPEEQQTNEISWSGQNPFSQGDQWSWSCRNCSYQHQGVEAELLLCANCFALKGSVPNSAV
eukprot:evm.model.scf_1790.1 EVM.evm.TU.scf_1790.1   scf_1790:5402-13406(-)